MKYLVMLCDGMADEPNAQLDNSTPMAKAVKPCMDYLASKGEVGMVKTVAEGLKPGSDVANMSVLGFDPKKCYTGRSPLEAVMSLLFITAVALRLRRQVSVLTLKTPM